MGKINRREFFKTGAIASVSGVSLTLGCGPDKGLKKTDEVQLLAQSMRSYNESYQGSFLDRIAFPIGGMGAGMVCLEGTGCISHVSVRNSPEIFNEPLMFGAISVKGVKMVLRY